MTNENGFITEYDAVDTDYTRESPSRDFSCQFDYVIVFPLHGEEHRQSMEARHVVHTMLRAGLELFSYLSVQKDELIVLFRCPLRKLETLAAKSDYRMEINAHHLQTVLERGNFDRRISKVSILDNPLITPLNPHEHIFLRFQEENDPELYNTPEGETSPFIKSVRLKLIKYLLTAPKRVGGCHIELSKLIHMKYILCIFPLHDREIADQLLEQCTAMKAMPWNDPVYQLKEYFGEKLAFFHLFIGHISWWLVSPSIVGIFVQGVVWATFDFSHPVLPVFTIGVIIWSTLMLKYWKQKESTTALHWGMTEFSVQDTDRFARPEFKGHFFPVSHINGKEMLYFPPSDFKQRLCLSLFVVASFIFLVMGIISGIYLIRFALQKSIGTFATGVSSALSVMQIMSFNFLYQQLAVKLTNQENHRTDLEYQDSLITKIFIFQFINSFASFFFLAFIAQNLDRPSELDDDGPEGDYVGQCGFTTCMIPLSINVATIFGGKIVFKNITDVFMPWLKSRKKLRDETIGVDPTIQLTPAEEEFMLINYDPFMENIKAYADSVVQWGYMMLFIGALPLTFAFGLFNNYVKMKLHAWKLFKVYQRPIPSSAQNIDSWHQMFTIVSVISIITNGGLICFTMNIFDYLPLSRRIWLFVGFQWTMGIFTVLIYNVLNDTPDYVHVQKQRMAFIKEKIVDKVEDDDFDPATFKSSAAGAGHTDDSARKLKRVKEFVYKKPSGTKPSHSVVSFRWFKSNFVRALPQNRANKQDDLPQTPVVRYPTSEDPATWPLPLDEARMPKQNTTAVLASGLDDAFGGLDSFL